MTLMKSMLLGSAAGIVAVAGAQAADLPTHKAAPVEYVRVCNVGGITGWVLPGSDTCVKLSGYITAQFEGGNLSNSVQPSGVRLRIECVCAFESSARRSAWRSCYRNWRHGHVRKSERRLLVAARAHRRQRLAAQHHLLP